MSNATYFDFLQYLKQLERDNDNRLHDNITVYDAFDGEYRPAEFVEFEGSDDVIDDGHIFLMTKDEY